MPLTSPPQQQHSGFRQVWTLYTVGVCTDVE